MKTMQVKAEMPSDASHGRLMVKTRGIVRFNAHPLLANVQRELAQGNEVRLSLTNDELGDAIRLYPMARADWQIIATAATMGEFRQQTFSDVQPEVRHKKQLVSREAFNEAREAHNERQREIRATPRRVVTCPNCGTDIALSGFFN